MLHLDMSNAACSDAAELNMKLNLMMEARCAEFGVPYVGNLPASGNFLRILESLPAVSRRGKTEAELKRPNAGKYVLLIDEYDAPIAKLLDTPEKRAKLTPRRSTNCSPGTTRIAFPRRET